MAEVKALTSKKIIIIYKIQRKNGWEMTANKKKKNVVHVEG
jgi:hypothetical protein